MRNFRAALFAGVAWIASSAGPAAGGPIVTGDFQIGERWNEPYLDPDRDRDDEDLEQYRFQNANVALEQDLTGDLTLFLRFDRNERTYSVATHLDNTVERLSARLRYDATDVLTVWLHGYFGRKDYERRSLDNEPAGAAVEARWRFGVRDNVRVGFTYDESRYDDEPGRDRTRRRLFAGWQRPLNDDFVLEVRGDVEDRGFRVPTAARQNSTSRSATVGFRWEL